MVKKSPCRIDGIIATEANIAVLFRRGPTRLCQMLIWNLDTDVVTPGQWMKARVWSQYGDISPDGKYLVLGLTDYSSRAERRSPPDAVQVNTGWSWTTISRPPFYTALSVAPTPPAAPGGGRWLSRGKVACTLDPGTWVVRAPSRPPIELVDSEEYTSALHRLNLIKRGWTVERTLRRPWCWRFSRRWAAGTITGVVTRLTHWWIEDTKGNVRWEWGDLRWSDHKPWIEVDHNGRLIFSDAGCLWAWDGFPEGEPRMIADLNPNRFQEVPCPDWARDW